MRVIGMAFCTVPSRSGQRGWWGADRIVMCTSNGWSSVVLGLPLWRLGDFSRCAIGRNKSVSDAAGISPDVLRMSVGSFCDCARC